MRDEQRRDPLVTLQRANLVAQREPRRGIQCRQRLVEQQRARLEHQRTCERDPLLLAAGQLAGPAIGKRSEADAIEHRERALATRRVVDMAHAQRIGDVLPDLHRGEQRIALEDDAAGTVARGCVGDDSPGEANVPPIRHEKARDQSQQRRLAATGGTHAREKLARRDRQRDIVHACRAPGIAEAHRLQRDGSVRHARSCAGHARPAHRTGCERAQRRSEQREHEQDHRRRTGEPGGPVERLQQARSDRFD